MDDREVGVRVVLDSNGLSRQALPPRQWRVLITQLDNQNAAPPGCLQYHREAFSQVRSLNYGEDFRDDLNYDICFSRLARSQKTDESCSRTFSTVELDQPLSYRHQRDLHINKRSAEIRELGNHSPPIQAIPDEKDVHEAFSDVISLVSKTVQEVQSGADLRDSVSQNSVNQNYIINPLPLVQSYSTLKTSSDNQDYITTTKVESSDQSPTKATEQEENMVTESVAEVLPILYSEGNEAVISQIQRVVQQLQQQHLGITADNDQDSLIFSDVDEPLVQFTTYSPPSLSDAMVDEVDMNEETRNEDQVLMQPDVAESNTNNSDGINELHDNFFKEEIVVETVITPHGPVLMLQNGASITSHKSSNTSSTEGQTTSDNDTSAFDVNPGISNEGLAISDEGSEMASDEDPTASEESLAASDNKGLVTHDEVPAASDEGSATAAPDDDLATSVPDKDLATVFPSEDQATAFPSKELTTFPSKVLTTTFLDEDLTAAFLEDQAITFPSNESSVTDVSPGISNEGLAISDEGLETAFHEDPTTSEENLAASDNKGLVTHDEVPAASDEGSATVTPDDDLATSVPNKDLATVFHNEDQATAFPIKDLTTIFPSKDLATAFPDEDLATVFSDEDLATILLDDSLATAFPDEDMAITSTDEGLTAASSNESLAVTTDEGLAAVSPDDSLTAASPYEGLAATSDDGPVIVSNVGITTASPEEGPAVTSEEGLAATFEAGSTTISPDDFATAPDKNFVIISDGSTADSDKDPATASLDKGVPVTISLDEGPTTASSIESLATSPAKEGLAAGSGEDLAEASYNKSPATGSSDMGLVTASSVEGLTVASSDEGLTAAFSDEGLTSTFYDEGSTSASLTEDLTTVSIVETSTVDALVEDLTVASTESLTEPSFIKYPVIASLDKGSAAAALSEDLTTSLNKGQATSDEESTTNESPTTSSNGGILGLKQTSVIVDQADFEGNVDDVDLMIEKMKDQFLTNYLVNDYQLPPEMDIEYDYDNEHYGDGGLNIMLDKNSGEDSKIPEAEMGNDGTKKVAPTEDGNPPTTDMDTDEESITSVVNLTGDLFLVSASNGASNHTNTSGITSALDITNSTYLASGLDPTSSLDTGNALAELTVVDPERVQVHGNLVIMDHSEDHMVGEEATVKIGNQSAVTPHPLNAEDEGSDDEHGEDLLMSLIEPEVVNLESGSILTHDPVEGTDPDTFSNTNLESIQDLGDGIHWLILSDSAAVDDGAASSVLTVPPEIIITSGIGFGSSSTDQYDLPVTTKLESSTALPNEIGILGEENDRETSTHSDVHGGENVKESQEESILGMAVELAGDDITEVVGEGSVRDAAKKENTTKESTDTFTEVVEEENIMKTGEEENTMKTREGENPVVTIGEYDIGVYQDNPGIYDHTAIPDTLEDEINSLESDDGVADNNTDECEGNIAVFSSSVDVDEAIYISVNNSGAGLLPVSTTDTSVNNSVKDTTIQHITVDPITNDGTMNTADDDTVVDNNAVNSIMDTTTGNNTVDITVDNSPVDITIDDSIVDTTVNESAIATAFDDISVDAAEGSAMDTVVDDSEMDFTIDDGSMDTSADEGAVDATVDITATDSVLHSGAGDVGIDSAVHVTVPVDDSATDSTIHDNLIETTVNDNAANASADITAAHITIEDSAVNTAVESAATATVYDDAMDSGVDSNAANTIPDNSVMVSSLDDSAVDFVSHNNTLDTVIGDVAADNTTRHTTKDTVAENAMGSNGVADTVIRDAANSGAINTVTDISEVDTVIDNSAVVSVVGTEVGGDTIVNDSKGEIAGISSEANTADVGEVDTAVDDSEVYATVANNEAVTEVNSDTADTMASHSAANTTASITIDDNAQDTAVVDSSGTLSGIEDGPVEDEHECGGSFLLVNDLVVCGSQLRYEPIFDEDYEDDRFQDVERVSVRTLEGAARSLRFSLEYNTTCPIVKVPTTPKPPGKKTVTLLQYLLGWYR